MTIATTTQTTIAACIQINIGSTRLIVRPPANRQGPPDR
jgi:hypothetical protein